MSASSDGSEILKVLLVEDNEAHAELIERAFGKSGALVEVVCAQTIQQARAHMAQSTPDLVLLDFLLPDGEGRELLPADGEDLLCPIVMLTSHGNEQVAVEALKAGAMDYVVKSRATFAEMPRLAARVLREWRHITERKQAEEELRASEEKYRELIENINDVIVTVNRDGEITYVSPAVERTYGYTPDELIRRSFAQFLHPDDLATEAEHLAKTLAGQAESHDLRVWRKSGELRWMHSANRPIVRDGEVVGVSSILSDVTERKQAEDRLRRTQFAMDHASESVFWVRPDGRFSYVNEAACRSLGYTREELLSMRVSDIDPLLPAEKWPAHHEQVRERGSITITTRQRRKDGREFPVEISINHVVFEGEEYHCAFARDISERVAAQEERKEQAEELRLRMAALESAASAIVITDRDGEIRWVNPAFTEITGYSAEEVAGKNLRLLKSGKQDQAFYKNLWDTILSGAVWRGQIVNRRKDGHIYTEEMTIAPVRNEQGRIYRFVAVKQDISERRDLEDQLRQAQKLEAIGRLAGGVAHDFNNQLFVINGYSEMLLKQLADQPALRKRAADIRKAGEHAANLTQQLLAFSRRQRQQLKVLDLNVQLKSMEKIVKALIGEEIAVLVIPGEVPSHAKVDPTQFEQIIFNLAINAKDAMPHGGSITIETANTELDETLAQASENGVPGPYVQVSVTDTGTGMDRETMARAFDPFFTTKEEGKGTGLGLATVHGIVKQSGGHIAVYSEPGQGTTFKLYFPQVDQSGHPVEAVAQPTALPRRSETILIAEDEAPTRTLLREAIEQGGFTVIEAENGAAALKVAAAFDGPIHILLTDVVMPEVGGPELAERLRAIRPETKIVYMSGYPGNATAHGKKIEEDAPFVQKPCTLNALLAKIHEVLDG